MKIDYKLKEIHLGTLDSGEIYLMGISYVASAKKSGVTAQLEQRMDFDQMLANLREPDIRYGIVAPIYDEATTQKEYEAMVEAMYEDEDARLGVETLLSLQFAPEENEERAERERMREERNNLLAASDWTQAVDCVLPEARQKEWAEYRKALREMFDTDSTTSEITWPKAPSS